MTYGHRTNRIPVSVMRALIEWGKGRTAESGDPPAIATTPPIKTGRTLVRPDQPSDPPWIDRSLADG